MYCESEMMLTALPYSPSYFCSQVVSWQPHGRGFVVRNKHRFEKEVLPL